MFCAALFESFFISGPSLGRRRCAGKRERERKSEKRREEKLEKRLARRCCYYNDSPLLFALDAPPPHIPSRYFCSEGPCYSSREERDFLFNTFKKDTCIYTYIYIYIKLYSRPRGRIAPASSSKSKRITFPLFCSRGVFPMQREEIGRRRWHVVKKRQNSFPSAAFKARPRGCRRSAAFVLRFRVKNRTARAIAAAGRACVSCVMEFYSDEQLQRITRFKS